MCPRCLALKLKINKIGSKMDMCQQLQNARMDNETRQYHIEVVRKMLFEKGINISSVKIERILGPTSAVPTRVCTYLNLIKTI